MEKGLKEYYCYKCKKYVDEGKKCKVCQTPLVIITENNVDYYNNRDIKYDKSKFTITGLIFLIIYALTSFILALRFAPKQMFLSRLEAFRGNGDGHLTEAKNTYIYLIFIAMCVFIVIAFLGSDYVPIFSGGVIAVISVYVFFKASRIAHNEAVYSASKALGYYCYAVALRYVLALWLISMVMLIIGQIRENLKRQHKI